MKQLSESFLSHINANSLNHKLDPLVVSKYIDKESDLLLNKCILEYFIHGKREISLYLLSYRTSRNLAKLSAYDNSSFYYYVSFTSSPPSDDICYEDGGSFAIDSSLRAIKENSLKSSGDSSCILRVSSLQNVRLLRIIIR